jgi:hypothetical protein
VATAPINGGQPQGDPNQARAAIEDFRQLAQMVQVLAQKYPEFTEAATQIMPLIQSGMVKVAGNSSRTPDQQAPPIGG